jgi:hypothetical protein
LALFALDRPQHQRVVLKSRAEIVRASRDASRWEATVPPMRTDQGSLPSAQQFLFSRAVPPRNRKNTLCPPENFRLLPPRHGQFMHTVLNDDPCAIVDQLPTIHD